MEQAPCILSGIDTNLRLEFLLVWPRHQRAAWAPYFFSDQQRHNYGDLGDHLDDRLNDRSGGHWHVHLSLMQARVFHPPNPLESLAVFWCHIVEIY
jgi:hypothetical protein